MRYSPHKTLSLCGNEDIDNLLLAMAELSVRNQQDRAEMRQAEAYLRKVHVAIKSVSAEVDEYKNNSVLDLDKFNVNNINNAMTALGVNRSEYNQNLQSMIDTVEAREKLTSFIARQLIDKHGYPAFDKHIQLTYQGGDDYMFSADSDPKKSIDFNKFSRKINEYIDKHFDDPKKISTCSASPNKANWRGEVEMVFSFHEDDMAKMETMFEDLRNELVTGYTDRKIAQVQRDNIRYGNSGDDDNLEKIRTAISKDAPFRLSGFKQGANLFDSQEIDIGFNTLHMSPHFNAQGLYKEWQDSALGFDADTRISKGRDGHHEAALLSARCIVNEHADKAELINTVIEREKNKMVGTAPAKKKRHSQSPTM